MKTQQRMAALGMRAQRGATLITVLVILVMITIVGVVATRVAITSLNISTNSQINHLLLQSADTPLNSYAVTTDISSITSISNVMGAALSANETTPGIEYIFCYKPMDRFSTVVKANSLWYDGTGILQVDNGTRGFCKLDADYGSGRQAVVTQVAVTIPTDGTGTPGAYLPRSSDVGGGSLPKSLSTTRRIRVTTTSMLPAYATSSLSTIQGECLSQTNPKISDDTDASLKDKETVAKCVAKYGVPVSVQVQEFNLATKLEESVAPGVKVS